ncbi:MULTISPECIES: hypothetical protein [Lysobacteraceae]|jgi:hypothetical protein|uniref:DUF2946 domain-containing protein n=2 Tax=Lysobacteraceae TaxID=32033 RepID=A0A7W3TJ47_9GAMM|nr:hypothetical protein [Lysobacter spongiae]MBB1059257.1 hypothetical protein [Lysobacter spongiae]
MQFHNTPAGRYHAPMLATAPSTMLGRLRASARLAALVLLVFAMKIGVVAACAQHDFALLGLGTDSTHQLIVNSVSDTDGADPAQGTLPQGSACTHCSCPHAVAVPVTPHTMATALPHARFGYAVSANRSAPVLLELRPPIV